MWLCCWHVCVFLHVWCSDSCQVFKRGNERKWLSVDQFLWRRSLQKKAIKEAVGSSVPHFLILFLFSSRSVTDPRDGKRVALKKMPNVFQNLVSCKRVFRELKMLSFFKHENVSTEVLKLLVFLLVWREMLQPGFCLQVLSALDVLQPPHIDYFEEMYPSTCRGLLRQVEARLLTWIEHDEVIRGYLTCDELDSGWSRILMSWGLPNTTWLFIALVHHLVVSRGYAAPGELS